MRGKLSDEDIEALIAYIRSQPAAGQTTPDPPDQVNPLGLMMLAAGMLPGGKPYLAAPSRLLHTVRPRNTANISCRIRTAVNATVPI
jgi:hypothetical protein